MRRLLKQLAVVFLLLGSIAAALAEPEELIKLKCHQKLARTTLDADLQMELSIRKEKEETVLTDWTNWQVNGCLERTFVYANGTRSRNISWRASEGFMKELGKLELKLLKEKKSREPAPITGELTVGGKTYEIECGPDNKIWMKLVGLQEKILVDFPADPQKSDSHTFEIQGDIYAYKEVTLAQLAENPARYAGRRVRVSGYLHREFEGDTLVEKKADVGNFDIYRKRGLWPGGPSTKANTEIQDLNDTEVIVDGTFEWNPKSGGGHLGLWLGRLSRITRLAPAPKPSR
jgi:hypothetical protein